MDALKIRRRKEASERKLLKQKTKVNLEARRRQIRTKCAKKASSYQKLILENTKERTRSQKKRRELSGGSTKLGKNER